MIKTEMRNPLSINIEKMSTKEMLELIQKENENAVKAVDMAIEQIEKACDAITKAFEKGGRLFYIGCGTSGRLGILDAVECPPTYGISQDQIVGIIAGGRDSVFKANENKEDSYIDGKNDIRSYSLSKNDIVVGISVSGNAKYVQGALEYAKSLGCMTIGLTSNSGSVIDILSDISIVTDTGAEVITGSTRMKAGTAHKIVLNMLSTCSMIKTGKVYENLMINVKPVNEKLKNRMINIVMQIFTCTDDKAKDLLIKYDWNIRHMIDNEGK